MFVCFNIQLHIEMSIWATKNADNILFNKEEEMDVYIIEQLIAEYFSPSM